MITDKKNEVIQLNLNVSNFLSLTFPEDKVSTIMNYLIENELINFAWTRLKPIIMKFDAGEIDLLRLNDLTISVLLADLDIYEY